MIDKNSKDDPKGLWQNQPVERTRISFQDLRGMADQMRRETQRNILASAGAGAALALAFWRLQFARNPWYDAGLVVAAVWAGGSLIWFRKRIWPGRPAPDAVSVNGLEFYRSEIMERRDHLRTAWFWLGPVFLALGILVIRLLTIVFGESVPIRNIAPFLVLSLIWVGTMVSQTRSRLRKLDKELKDLASQGVGDDL